MLNALLSKVKNKLIDVRPLHLPPDIEPGFKPIYLKCRDYTMTSYERMYSMYKATEYIFNNNIKGSIVECGVWKGGSLMTALLTLIKNHETKRKIYAYDTFAGMAQPTKKDVRIGKEQELAINEWRRNQPCLQAGRQEKINKWTYSSLKEVNQNLYSTNYPKKNLLFVKGKVEETIPKILPEKIALLRLDTDWYASTYHELKYLYPLLSLHGILIIDDYGHWRGCKEAVDQYFKEKRIHILLNRIDYTGRLGIKI